MARALGIGGVFFRSYDPKSLAEWYQRCDYMFNLVVDDLDGALEQVREGGAELVGGVEEQEYGRFGWFMDPEGNKVELWQPKG
jgi:predicted enzyme related to lactoylglutathione lyase